MLVTGEANDISLRNAGEFVTPELKLFSSFLGKKPKKHNLIYIKLIYFSRKFSLPSYFAIPILFSPAARRSC